VLAEVPRATRIVEEQRWIAALREAGYRLTNGTDGGEGPERYKPTEQTRRRQSEAGRRRFAKNPAEREYYRKLLLDRYKDPAERRALAEQARAQWAAPGAREAQSARLKELCSDPEFVRRRGETLRRTLLETDRGRELLQQMSQRVSGEANPSAKLTWNIVREIRARYKPGVVTQRKLAVEFGVEQSLVAQIIACKIWVNDPVGGRPTPPPIKPRGKPLTDDRLQDVAAVYRTAFEAGTYPTHAVAAHFDVTAVVATSWVATSRRRGFLGATTAGKAGC
jgi:hypothetical protein